ncbi:MAG: TrmH family RNA methyltransferase [Eubacteriales bacterium]|nr:TrmH family RNA methyltransferase [Eubacteriales bacterium]
MKTIEIYSQNADYQRLEVLKTNRNKRYRYNEFFVEGVRNIKAAVLNGWKINSFIYSDYDSLSGWAKGVIHNVPTEVNYHLTPELMKEISSKEDTSEILAIIKMREDSTETVTLSGNPLIALFDRPSNKGNLGTIIRSCDSFGIDCLFITGHSVDLYDPEVITASMGSFFNVHTVRIDDNAKLFEYFYNIGKTYPDLQLVGTTAHKQVKLSDVNFTRPTVLMIGNETMGLNAAFRDKCDILATIPMNESCAATSFNVACAATVCFYEAIRQRENTL